MIAFAQFGIDAFSSSDRSSKLSVLVFFSSVWRRLITSEISAATAPLAFASASSINAFGC